MADLCCGFIAMSSSLCSCCCFKHVLFTQKMKQMKNERGNEMTEEGWRKGWEEYSPMRRAAKMVITLSMQPHTHTQNCSRRLILSFIHLFFLISMHYIFCMFFKPLFLFIMLVHFVCTSKSVLVYSTFLILPPQSYGLRRVYPVTSLPPLLLVSCVIISSAFNQQATCPSVCVCLASTVWCVVLIVFWLASIPVLFSHGWTHLFAVLWLTIRPSACNLQVASRKINVQVKTNTFTERRQHLGNCRSSFFDWKKNKIKKKIWQIIKRLKADCYYKVRSLNLTSA